MKTWLTSVGLALLLACAPARAEIVRNLYGAERIVTGTEEPERSRGFREALEDVLVKVTGDTRLGSSEKIKPLLERASALVAGFVYQDRMKDLPVRDEQGTRDRPHVLRVWFDEPTLKSWLLALGLRAWPVDRPRVMMALWVERPGATDRQFFVADTGDYGLLQRQVALDHARKRGLPLVFPSAKDASKQDGIWRLMPRPYPDATEAPLAEALRTRRIEDFRKKNSIDAMLTCLLGLEQSGTWSGEWDAASLPEFKDLGRLPVRHVSFDTAIKDGIDMMVRALSGNE